MSGTGRHTCFAPIFPVIVANEPDCPWLGVRPSAGVPEADVHVVLVIRVRNDDLARAA
jgi:hypothetical protein